MASGPEVAPRMADVYTTAADAWTELGVDGQVVGIRGTSTSDYGAVLTPGNGGSVTRIANGAFDGVEDALRIVPPSETVGGEGQYCGILHALPLSPGGVNTVRQINIRWLAEHGPTYWSHSSNSKVTGVLMSAVNASPGVSVKRAAVFDQAWPPRPDHDQKVLGVTYGTTQSYHEPESGIDEGDEEDKLCYLRGTDNHANSPPIIGTDCVCFELEVTSPGYNGQTNGRNKLYMWTRDGVVTERYLDIEFTYAEDFDPSKIWLTDVEYLGGYWNDAGTADENNYVDYQHCALSANRDLDDPIGPPDGFFDEDPPDDTTPNAFSFVDQTGVARSSTITSAVITVSGIDAPATITITGGTYDINGSGTFVSTPGTVNNGDTVRARHTSSASYETATNTVVTIGGVSDTFTSTTESEIIIPAYRWFRVPRR